MTRNREIRNADRICRYHNDHAHRISRTAKCRICKTQHDCMLAAQWCCSREKEAKRNKEDLDQRRVEGSRRARYDVEEHRKAILEEDQS